MKLPAIISYFSGPDLFGISLKVVLNITLPIGPALIARGIINRSNSTSRSQEEPENSRSRIWGNAAGVLVFVVSAVGCRLLFNKIS